MTTSAFQALADHVGIVAEYTDFHGHRVTTGRATQEALLAAFGITAKTEVEARRALDILTADQAARVLPFCLEINAGQAHPLEITGNWTVTLETGDVRVLGSDPECLPPLPVGIHNLSRSCDGQTCWLLARPRVAPSLQSLTGQDKVWGAIGAIYALSSRRNAGLGDYRDLADAAGALGGHGAAFLGINPVHAMGVAADAGLISPYSPSHRGFANTWHIALDDLERFGGCNVPGTGTLPDGVVDYPASHIARTQAFEASWHVAKGLSLPKLVSFRDAGGTQLARFALFETLSETQGGDWRYWPAEFKDPDSPACRQFADQNADRIAYHIWLQWIAQTQVSEAQAAARANGMALGLYLDYAVGARPGGAETWMGGSSHLQGVSLGAPPDPVSSTGQTWGLAPLSPFGLRRTGYRAFAALLRGVMRQCGMIRIDHVLGFFRAFLIPETGAPGAYVRYPFEEMLAVVMIEAHKAGVLVVGEDLGLVPEGFRESLADRGIYGLDIAQFWMKSAQSNLPPDAFRAQAIAGFGTHDTPTLAGYITGADLANLHKLGLLDDVQLAQHRKARRPQPAVSVLQARDRLHDQLAASRAALVSVQLDDVTVEEMQQNLPGTVDQYPNWQKRHRIAVEDMSTHAELGAQAALMRAAGRSQAED